MDCEFKHLLVPQGQDNIVEEVIEIFSNSEYNLVRVSINGNKKIQIQILAENKEFNMSLNDCEIVNGIVKEQLDKNPNLYDNYSLEISSPGIERPLTRKIDFNIWSNNYVKVKLFRHDNLPRRFEARLIGIANPSPAPGPDLTKVFIPITSPFELINGPPELPGFIAASV